jgi:hypothetical protein
MDTICDLCGKPFKNNSTIECFPRSVDFCFECDENFEKAEVWHSVNTIIRSINKLETDDANRLLACLKERENGRVRVL